MEVKWKEALQEGANHLRIRNDKAERRAMISHFFDQSVMGILIRKL